MPNTKTRFTINAAGIDAEVFSVMERANGDLIIVPRRYQQLGNGDTEIFHDVNEVRFSAHVSPSAIGNTFVSHQRLANHTYTKGYSYVTPYKGRMSWLLYSVISTDLTEEHYRLRASAKDRIVSMGGYSPSERTLFYNIVVVSPDLRFAIPLGMNASRADFRYFSVLAIWAFQGLPSFHRGETLLPALGVSAGENSSGAEGRVTRSAQALNKRQLERAIYYAGHFLAEKQIRNMQRFLPGLLPEFGSDLIHHGSALYKHGSIEEDVNAGI